MPDDHMQGGAAGWTYARWLGRVEGRDPGLLEIDETSEPLFYRKYLCMIAFDIVVILLLHNEAFDGSGRM